MHLSLAALLKTVTGKTIAGLLVATTSVGAAAAAGADVPVLNTVIHRDADDDQGEEPAAEDDQGEQGEQGEEPAAEPGDDDQGEAKVAALSDGESEEPGEDEDEVEVDESDERDEGDHGQIVSEFTRITAAELELTGCAKGQATAAVARGDVQVDSETLAEDLVPFIERCPHQEDGDEEEPVEGDLDPKQVHEAGKAAFHKAQQAYDDECGDDDEDADDRDGSESSEDDDESMSEVCQELKTAAKTAHADWKRTTKAAREAAKEARHADDEDPLDEADIADEDVTESDHPGKGHGKAKGQSGSNGNGKGKGKNG